jgi:hypothetical protein
VLRYLGRAGGGLAAISLATVGAYFVAAVTGGHPQPWWPYLLLFDLVALGGLFTGTWPGAGWEILPGCAETVAPPYPAGDIYRCMFDPQAAGVPALTNMTLSFDVYGTSANARPFNLSPNGARQVSWGWRCTHTPPASTCLGW